jgi:beta-lactamase superfamily II metal-dependent hydrolase
VAVALYTLDVGHGLCQVIMLGGDRAILIDGGSAESRSVAEEFLDRFVGHVVAYVGTHNDADHTGAAIHLLDRYPTKDRLRAIWLVHDRGSDYRIPLLGYAQRRLEQGSIERWHLCNVQEDARHRPRPRLVHAEPAQQMRLELLYPRMEDVIDASRATRRDPEWQNRSSACMRLSVGGTVALITGDLDLVGFTVISERYRFDLKADLLSVPHHGGHIPDGDDGCLSWDGVVARVNPGHAVVSSGYRALGTTRLQEASFGPFVARGIAVCCTQITGHCHPSIDTLRPSVLRIGGRDVPQMSGQARFPKAVGCFGSILALLEPGKCTILHQAEHASAVGRLVGPKPGSPYCRG